MHMFYKLPSLFEVICCKQRRHMIVKDELMAMFVRKKSLPRNNGEERQARFKVQDI